MKTILVSTDFSKEAENAVEYAAAMAKVMGAQVMIYNSFVVPPHFSNSLLPASAYQELIDHNNEILNNRALKLQLDYGITAGFESDLLNLEEDLNRLVVKYNAGFVVMGMAKKSLDQDLFGNTTTSVIMKMKHQVLSVPYTSRFSRINKILFACEEDMKDHHVFDTIKDLALILGAEVEVFNVVQHADKIMTAQQQRDATEVIDELLEGVSHSFRQLESNYVISEIENELIRQQADLLIMVPRKYGFLKSIIHRSKTRIMATNNNVPLLTIPL